jgi:hypothetical protein
MYQLSLQLAGAIVVMKAVPAERCNPSTTSGFQTSTCRGANSKRAIREKGVRYQFAFKVPDPFFR